MTPENDLLINTCATLARVAATANKVDDHSTAAMFVLGGYRSDNDDLIACIERAQEQLTVLQVEMLLQINAIHGALAVTHDEQLRRGINETLDDKIGQWQVQSAPNRGQA